jgi:DNA-binding transcriptional MerR regulator
MPAEKRVLNAFTSKEVRQITGVTAPMLDYLCRFGYLRAAHVKRGPKQGRVRYFSYRDLVVANVIQHLRDTGIRLSRLKAAIKFLRYDHAWFPTHTPAKPIHWLVSDGKQVLLKNDDGFLDELRPGGQRAFAFVVNLDGMQREVKARMEPKKRRHFTIENLDIIPEAKRPKRAKA